MKKVPIPQPAPAESNAGLMQWTDQLAKVNQSVDPFGVGASFAKVAAGWVTHPAELATALAQLARDLQGIQFTAWQMASGLKTPPAVKAALPCCCTVMTKPPRGAYRWRVNSFNAMR